MDPNDQIPDNLIQTGEDEGGRYFEDVNTGEETYIPWPDLDDESEIEEDEGLEEEENARDDEHKKDNRTENETQEKEGGEEAPSPEETAGESAGDAEETGAVAEGAEAVEAAEVTAEGAEVVAGAEEAAAVAGTSEIWIWGVVVLFVILAICLILWLFFIIYSAANPGGGTTPTGTNFDCTGKSYSFPYSDINVPKIPKDHHDYSAIDLYAPDGSGLVAVTNGRILKSSFVDRNDGGISFTLLGDDGYTYYYAHLESLDPKIKAGAKVTAGQYVGKSGHSGNAKSTPPHLHFGISKGEQTKGFYPSKVYNPKNTHNPRQVSPWQTITAWKKGECIVPGT